MDKYLEYFLEMIAGERNASHNTIVAYRRDIADYIKYLQDEELSLSGINTAQFERYISSNFNDLSARSVARKTVAIKGFYHFLVEEGMVEHNPLNDVSSPKMPQLLPKSLSTDQLDKLLEHAAADDSPQGIRLYCILELLYSTGLRISELIALKMSDINRHHDDDSLYEYMIIKGKRGKERLVALNPSACEALEKYLKIRDALVPKAKIKQAVWLFSSQDQKRNIVPISRQRVGQMLKALAKDVGVDPQLISPHKIRHTFASHMVQNGANIRFVQELMGHSSIASTQIYTKVLDAKAQDLVLKQHPLGKL